MKTHVSIDKRSMALHDAVVRKIDADPEHKGIAKARSNCVRWVEMGSNCGAIQEWLQILNNPWSEIRKVLLDTSEYGCRLRQSNPFSGILSNQERWAIYKRFKDNETL
jgi:hypothetical protein